MLPNGQFEVTLYEGKYRPEPVTVTVDSNLFVGEDGEPIYTHSSTGELWPMILEKSLCRIQRGSTGHRPRRESWRCDSGVHR